MSYNRLGLPKPLHYWLFVPYTVLLLCITIKLSLFTLYKIQSTTKLACIHKNIYFKITQSYPTSGQKSVPLNLIFLFTEVANEHTVLDGKEILTVIFIFITIQDFMHYVCKNLLLVAVRNMFRKYSIEQENWHYHFYQYIPIKSKKY